MTYVGRAKRVAQHAATSFLNELLCSSGVAKSSGYRRGRAVR